MSRNSSKQAQAKGGFTLVELVVVIAVLAILAGVGAVAYNGYIEYAKKGVDRKTVGEIEHAMELADYSDSSLIPEGSSATVYLTSSGTSAFDGEKTSEFTASIVDALGDLSTVKLSYGKWSEEEDSFNPSVVSTLLEGMKDKWEDTTSSIYQYLHSDGSASFAGNIEEYWKSVQDYIALFSGLYGEGASDDEKGYLLHAVVNESTEPGLASKYVEYFGKGGTDSSGLNPASKSYRAAAVASNYAFAAWLNLHHSADITASMEEKYDSLTSVGTVVENFYSWKNDSDWKPLIEEYYESQGETDMLAYLGMLEAAKTMEPAEGKLKDEEFVPLAGKVVNVAAGILNRSVDHKELEALVKTLADNGGSIIAVKATKTNGQLIFDVDPDSANPRPDNGGSGSMPCNKIHNDTLTVTYANRKFTPDTYTVELCGSSDEHKSCVVTTNITLSDKDYSITPSGGVNVSSYDNNTKQFTITATSSGTVTITYNDKTATITVNVH